MQQEAQQAQKSQKKFEIIEEWHRQKPQQKVYKIQVYMIGIMYRAEEKLKARYQQSSSQNISSTTSLGNRTNQDFDEQFLNNSILSEESSSQQSSFDRISPQKQIKIYEDFKNRGKFQCLKFFFNRKKQRITILISQNYFINQLKCRQFDLLFVYRQFTKVWEQEYINIMQSFIKFSKDYKSSDFLRFQFVAIDIVGVTFDVAYFNKISDKISQLKRFRFRYSPFEFRKNPFFEQKNTEQTMSFVQINPNNVNVSHQDYYTNMRLGFIDDINNNSNDLWKRVVVRFWVFYQLHSLNRGISDFQQFNKKALGRVQFHSIRMKKFQLIFPFPLLHQSIIQQKKQGVIYFTFYLDDKDTSMSEHGLQFTMNVNLVQHHNMLSFDQKEQLFNRLKKQQAFTIRQKQPSSKSNQLFEFFMTLKFDEKIARAFAKFELIVSFYIDKIAFNDVRSLLNQQRQALNPDQNEFQKVIEICSKTISYKQYQYMHSHQLSIQLKHKLQVPYQNPNQNLNSPKYVDEIQFHKVYKKKNKKNLKQNKDEPNEKNQLFISDDLKKYIGHLLRTKPLREVYKQIIEFVQNVVKVIYSPFRQSNSLIKYQNRQISLSMIISNIIKFLDLANHHSRKSEISIITDDSPLFMRDEHENNLVAEITFNIKDLKIYWIKRLPEGYIIIRLFEDKLEVVKDLNSKIEIKINYSAIQKTSNQLMIELKNILMKQFATLQNMMV